MTNEINLIAQLNFWSLLLIICAGQGYILGVILLFHKKGNASANKILSILIFCFSYYFLFIAAYWSNYLVKYPHMLGTLRILNYSWGPLFYLYVSAVINKNKKFRLKQILHFIPTVVSITLTFSVFLLDTDTKVEIIKKMLTGEYTGANINNILPSVLFNFHILLYSFLSIKKITEYSKSINGNKNTLMYINYKWLLKLSFGFVGFFISWFIYEILMYAGVNYHIEVDYIITFFGVVVVYTIVIYSMKQPEIFSGISIIKNEAKYEKTNIPFEEAQNYINTINDLMKKENLYLNPDFNLRTLAVRLDISTHKLSQILNEHLKVNFADFINNYRIEEAKLRLTNPEYSNLTILSIAYDVGFNNKVSFNKTFKKITGITPSEYKLSQAPHFTN